MLIKVQKNSNKSINFHLLISQFGFNGTFQQDLGGTLLLFLRTGALQAEIRGKGSNKVYLKGTIDRNLTLNQWMAHKK